MRNCFKRYDKANTNIDFNNVVGSNGQPNGQTSNTQTAPSPMVKSGTLKT